MTDELMFEQELVEYLADGPTRMSRDVLHAVLAQIHTTAQDRAPARTVRERAVRAAWLAVAVGVAVAVVLVGLTILRATLSHDVAAPTIAPSPTAVARPTPSLAPSPSPAVERPTETTPAVSAPTAAGTAGSALPLGILPAGSYTSRIMSPSITFATRGDLTLRGERAHQIWLSLGVAPTAPEFDVIVSDETDAIARIRADPRTNATPLESITVAGYQAHAITITMAADAYPMTNRNRYDPNALIIGQRDEWYIYMPPGAKARIIELTAGGKDILVFYVAQVAAFDDFAGVADQVLASLSLGA